MWCAGAALGDCAALLPLLRLLAALAALLSALPDVGCRAGWPLLAIDGVDAADTTSARSLGPRHVANVPRIVADVPVHRRQSLVSRCAVGTLGASYIRSRENIKLQRQHTSKAHLQQWHGAETPICAADMPAKCGLPGCGYARPGMLGLGGCIW